MNFLQVTFPSWWVNPPPSPHSLHSQSNWFWDCQSNASMAQFPLILSELKTWVTVDFALGNFTQNSNTEGGSVKSWCVCVCVCVCMRERDRQTQRNLTDFIGSKAQFWPKWMLTLLSNSLFIASIWPNAGELKSELALPQHLVQTPRLRFPPQKGSWDSKLAKSPSNNSLHCLTLQKHSHVPWEPCWKIHSVFKLNR